MSRMEEWPDLASSRLGARAVAASDEFFAPKERLLDPDPPMFDPDRYTERGKWMDGWETRRRRGPGNDWVVVRLAAPTVVREVVVDTAHFDGNHPSSASVEAAVVEEEPEDPRGWIAPAIGWSTIVPLSPLDPDAEHAFSVESDRAWTHVRLSIHPDGGVARLRVRGRAAPDPGRMRGEAPIDLSGVLYGGRVLAASDARFGPPHRLLFPGPAEGMWDGWETRRRREPGHDWVVVRLGGRGEVERAVVDTSFFLGNHPERASLELADLPDAPFDTVPEEEAWSRALAPSRLDPDSVHVFAPPELQPGPATHARLAIHPDGGVARLRLFGRPS
ncbi:MAG: allantoicase [Gemmatimonadota bacterium]|nr:allantoicase [Gemmatimonadota bacterium]